MPAQLLIGFNMEYDAYQQVPGDIQDKLLKEYEESQNEED